MSRGRRRLVFRDGLGRGEDGEEEEEDGFRDCRMRLRRGVGAQREVGGEVKHPVWRRRSRRDDTMEDVDDEAEEETEEGEDDESEEHEEEAGSKRGAASKRGRTGTRGRARRGRRR